MQIIDHTLARLRYSTQGRTLAEMALVRIANLENLAELSDTIAQLRGEAAGSISSTAGSPPRAAPATRASQPAAAKKKPETANGSPATEHREPDGPPRAAALSDETAGVVWTEALENLSGLLAENAARCEAVSVAGPDRLVVPFRAKYTACKSFCERPEQLAMLQRALAEAAGGLVKVEFAVLADDEPVAARGVGRRQRLAEVTEHPLVRRATELFDAHVVRVDEPDK
jgi:DNA polymerase-3 subunit gamma/tau